MSVPPQHERMKYLKVQEKAKERLEEEEKRRRAEERLKQLNAEAVRARLAYKGLINSESLHRTQATCPQPCSDLPPPPP